MLKNFNEDGRLMTKQDIAEWMSVSKAEVSRMVRTGVLPPPLPLPGAPRWRKRDLEDAMTSLSGKVTPKPRLTASSYKKGLPAALEVYRASIRRYRHVRLAVVYFLIKDGEVVYVGSTTGLGSRIATHRADKDFDDVFYIPVPRALMLSIERDMIQNFRPPLNLKGLEQVATAVTKVTLP
jgi:hypothetical protein